MIQILIADWPLVLVASQELLLLIGSPGTISQKKHFNRTQKNNNPPPFQLFDMILLVIAPCLV